MPIWKLEPTNIESTDWQGSYYKGPVVVRAKNDNVARDLASEKFGIAVSIELGQNTPERPWVQEELVKCKQLRNLEYEEAGPEEILSPLD